jgi:glycogen debranching enzyme
MVKQTNMDAPLQRLDLSLSQVQLGWADTDIVPATPKTPADEGKDFFSSERSVGEQPIRVYELRLDPDGGPNKQRSAS